MTEPSVLERLYEKVIARGLCAACGACVGNCPYLVKHKGRTVKLDSCTRSDGSCYTFCPAVSFDPGPISQAVFSSPYDMTGLGNFADVKASRSTSGEILAKAQGGGTVTSLMSMALEKGLIDAAILTSAEGHGLFAGGTIATTRESIRACAGSKFIGAHTLEALTEAFRRGFTKIGLVALPCQVRSVRKMQLYDIRRQNIRERLQLVVGLFCNWSFSADGFASFIGPRIRGKQIRKFDVPPPPANVFTIETEDGVSTIPLDDLRSLIQSACQDCPDMTSEFADLSVGMYEGRAGWNTLLIRTKAGAELVHAAKRAGVLETEPFPRENLAHLRQASINKKERISRTISSTGGGH